MLIESLRLDLSSDDPRIKTLLDSAKRRMSKLVDSQPEHSSHELAPWLELAAFHTIFAILKFSRNTKLKQLFAQNEARKAAIRFLSNPSPMLRMKVASEVCTPRISYGRLFLAGSFYTIKMPVWDYLASLGDQKTKRLRLVNRPIRAEHVYLQDQELAPIIEERVRNQIETKFNSEKPSHAPAPLESLISWVNHLDVKAANHPDNFTDAKLWESDSHQVFVPTASRSHGAARKRDIYHYIENLLKNPVVDGRHRLVWLVITPYLINVRKLSVERAIEETVDFLRRCGWSEPHLERLANYHVRRAKRIGLMPPRPETLARRDPYLYSIIKGTQT